MNCFREVYYVAEKTESYSAFVNPRRGIAFKPSNIKLTRKHTPRGRGESPPRMDSAIASGVDSNSEGRKDSKGDEEIVAEEESTVSGAQTGRSSRLLSKPKIDWAEVLRD